MELEAELEEARETFKSGKTRSFLWRQSQLRALERLLGEEEEAICIALKHDLGKHRLEAFRDEVGVLIKSVDFALENLKKWTTPEKFKKIEDNIEFIRERQNPLVIYAFTKDEKLKSRIVAETSSGSVTFNDTMIQYVSDTLPFGGVGQSGFGQYHGKFSFDLFSHRQAVMRRGFITEFTFR